VIAVAADITTPEGGEQALAACPKPDTLVNNAGGPPPGDFREWDREVWIKALDANMLTPIELIKATVDGMISRKFGRIVNITSSSVKAPVDILGLSNGARTGLTGFVAGLARKTVVHNVTINNILPGLFDTDRLKQQRAEHHAGLLPDDPNARARAITWMFAALNTMEPPIVDLEMVMLLERDEPGTSSACVLSRIASGVS
jgi:3-oxoacyl-[acyl-carrier protein] reductase